MRNQIGSTANFLGVGVLPFAFVRGSFILLGFCALMFIGVVIGYYTERGSGITARPYGKIYGGAPGAFGPGNVSGHDDHEHTDWSRGTR
ncbi:MAG: hypothetical protein QOD53_422 [Thermoleophilaceae bacterium]|jgi:hypothetical protein|nr:hypothetical protein [Thermoleophilaceae bacterium]